MSPTVTVDLTEEDAEILEKMGKYLEARMKEKGESWEPTIENVLIWAYRYSLSDLLESIVEQRKAAQAQKQTGGGAAGGGRR